MFLLVAIIVNNMASVCAGTDSKALRRKHRARGGQAPPDLDRAKRLAEAAARLVRIVESAESDSSQQLLEDSECTMARVVIAFNLRALSEVSVSFRRM